MLLNRTLRLVAHRVKDVSGLLLRYTTLPTGKPQKRYMCGGTAFGRGGLYPRCVCNLRVIKPGRGVGEPEVLREYARPSPGA